MRINVEASKGVSNLSIYYINKRRLKELERSHHVRRESLEIPALIKKKKICTVGFYEDLTV